jgi:parvulin-like peptidyl-prolyl isomerase
LKALEALSALEGGETWNTTVEKFSDSGISTHGELGNVTRQDVTPSFGDAAFSLDVDELSYVVESDRGFHIILRTK